MLILQQACVIYEAYDMGHMTRHKTLKGIIPRFYSELLFRLKEFHDSKMISASSVEISFFEIYNERIHDLLTDDPKECFQRLFENFAFMTNII